MENTNDNKDGFGDILTIEEAAEFLQLSVAVVRRFAKTGQMPCRMIANKYRFSKKSLIEWVGQGDKSSGSENKGA